MNDIKEAECCGTCRHWRRSIHADCGECVVECFKLPKKDIIEICKKHEWKNDERSNT